MPAGTFDRSETIIGHAKQLHYSADGSTGWVKLAGTISITLPERELGSSEITNDDTPDFHKDYRPGMIDPGKITVTYRYTKTEFAAMETLFLGRTNRYWRVTLPDGSIGVCQGFITKNSLPVDGGEDSPECEMEIQTTTKMTFTPGT